MKKLNAIICCLVLAVACVLLVGCGSGSKGEPKDMSDSAYVGTWQATHAEALGEEVDVKEAVGEMVLKLNADGTATLESSDDSSAGTWSEVKGGVKTQGEDFNVEFEDKDGVLEMSVIGVTITFERQ